MNKTINRHPGLIWPEAEVVSEPVDVRHLDTPKILVKRNLQKSLISPHGEEFVSLPGHPVISLFTGAGGFDIGLEHAGFCCVLQHEFATDPCKTLIANRPRYFRHAALIQGDIRATTSEMILEQSGLRVGQAEIICGGPPCQGFTTANANAVKGKYDRRNDLVFEYLRVVNEVKPAYFIMENVPGFQTFNDGAYVKEFLQQAYGCYYELVYGLCCASNYGVPQHRVRFICMGTRRDVALIENRLAGLPAPTHFPEEILSLVRALDGSPLFTREQKRYMRSPGIRYFPDREILFAPSPRVNGSISKGYMDFYDRLEKEEPDRIVQVGSKGR